MIHWNVIDEMPHGNGVYLVTDGIAVVVATLSNWGNDPELEWFLPDQSKVDQSNITHWAKINLPD